MRKYFINNEIKITFLRLIITLVLALGIFSIGLNVLLGKISAVITKDNIEMTGKLVEKYPQLEEDINYGYFKWAN